MTASFFFQRLLQMLATLFLMSFIVYGLIGLMPGDPIDLMAGGNPKITSEDLRRLKELHGLDKPLLSRYGAWLQNALAGDVGYSRLQSLPVMDVLLPPLRNTLLLMGAALFCTLLFAVPLGVYAAAKAGSFFDRAVNVFILAGVSVPAFWLALMLIALFAVTLGWLPAAASLSKPLSLILPLATLTLANLAVYVRHLRAAMLSALEGHFIRTARAKGCAQDRVLWRHAFQNALPPLLTLVMLDLGALAGGAITVETIFAYPGMGKLMFDAVMGSDYNLALIGFLLLTFFVMLGNFLADVGYRLIDPRVEKDA